MAKGTGILPARGGLRGPAFFPEGLGLLNPTADALRPHIMAIGHNFGCEDYRKEIDASGREDDKPTWRNLRRLLADADVGLRVMFYDQLVYRPSAREQTGRGLPLASGPTL